MTALATAASVRAEGLAHRYGTRRALEPLEFAAEGPGVVAVTGENGSGKSTLLRIAAGLLRPSAGRFVVEVGGAEVPAARRFRLAGLATPELCFYEEMSARENLRFAAEARVLPAAAAAAERALELAGLTSRAADRVAAYSSGMKQRLRLAFAVLHEPALVLLDEPGSHLDEAGRLIVRRMTEAIGRERLVLLATNDPREMDLAGTRIELRGRGLGDPS